MIGAIVGAADKADRLALELEARIADARRRGQQLRYRPLVYFEEWDEPMISGIAWVSELIEIAGGTDIFADRAIGKRQMSGSSRLKRLSPDVPTSSSARGAARNFDPRRSLLGLVSNRYRPSAMERSMRSSPRSSCSRGQPP
jgi:ABC-type Fe3+-hydroxamate transport system substrate-binding protein